MAKSPNVAVVIVSTRGAVSAVTTVIVCTLVTMLSHVVTLSVLGRPKSGEVAALFAGQLVHFFFVCDKLVEARELMITSAPVVSTGEGRLGTDTGRRWRLHVVRANRGCVRGKRRRSPLGLISSCRRNDVGACSRGCVLNVQR